MQCDHAVVAVDQQAWLINLCPSPGMLGEQLVKPLPEGITDTFVGSVRIGLNPSSEEQLWYAAHSKLTSRVPQTSSPRPSIQQAPTKVDPTPSKSDASNLDAMAIDQPTESQTGKSIISSIPASPETRNASQQPVGVTEPTEEVVVTAHVQEVEEDFVADAVDTQPSLSEPLPSAGESQDDSPGAQENAKKLNQTKALSAPPMPVASSVPSASSDSSSSACSNSVAVSIDPENSQTINPVETTVALPELGDHETVVTSPEPSIASDDVPALQNRAETITVASDLGSNDGVDSARSNENCETRLTEAIPKPSLTPAERAAMHRFALTTHGMGPMDPSQGEGADAADHLVSQVTSRLVSIDHVKHGRRRVSQRAICVVAFCMAAGLLTTMVIQKVLPYVNFSSSAHATPLSELESTTTAGVDTLAVARPD